MRARSSSLRSWLCALLALAFGLGLYVYDDWAETVSIPLAKSVLSVLEILVMGPAMAVLAFLISERLRAKDDDHRHDLVAEREKRFRFLGRIAASLAHEVRNPLHNLHLLGHELAQRASAADRELVEAITANIERLDHATRLIYALAKPPDAAGAGASPVDLAPLLDEVAGEAQRRAGRPAALTCGAAGAVLASGDREAVRIVLHNLVRNAIEAADGGAVDIACREEPGAAVVEIRNPGEAPPELLVDDADAVSRKPGGLGVGVAIARHLAAALGGSLRFDGGGGTVRARLELPRAR